MGQDGAGIAGSKLMSRPGIHIFSGRDRTGKNLSRKYLVSYIKKLKKLFPLLLMDQLILFS
jgi:hypothetical protein